MILPDNPIPELVSRHRKLKARRDAIDKQIVNVKDELQPEVEAIGGKWTDDLGYAKIITRNDSVSYNNSLVDQLARTWSKSDDSIMRSCGEMLLELRKEKAGYSYLQIK